MSLPNAITLSRLLLLAPFAWLLFAGAPRWALLALFALAALTDGLDGLVARRLGQVTPQGAWLDQWVDRVFTALIALLLLLDWRVRESGDRSLPLLLALCCAREIVSLPGIAIALWRGVPLYHVEFVGKLATCVQGVALGSVVLDVPWALYLVLPCAALGAVSGANYLRYASGWGTIHRCS